MIIIPTSDTLIKLNIIKYNHEGVHRGYQEFMALSCFFHKNLLLTVLKNLLKDLSNHYSNQNLSGSFFMELLIFFYYNNFLIYNLLYYLKVTVIAAMVLKYPLSHELQIQVL